MITDEQLISDFTYWLYHYTSNGDRHYSDTKDWKIVELYYDQIVDRVLEGLPEMTDDENEDIVERLNNLI